MQRLAKVATKLSLSSQSQSRPCSSIMMN